MSYDDVEDARLYDVQNPWGPGDEFYLGLIRGAGDVLDVGCGTGALLKRARQEGHRGRLLGLDPGVGMLAVAREEPSVEWVSGVLTPGAYDAEFDLLTMTGHAFQELRTDSQVRDTLWGMRDAVRPGGRVAEIVHPRRCSACASMSSARVSMTRRAPSSWCVVRDRQPRRSPARSSGATRGGDFSEQVWGGSPERGQGANASARRPGVLRGGAL